MGKASIKRFYYNPTTKRCEEFIYGGLGGNKNNFEDETICMETCGDICLLPKKIGPCKASIPRYYYNSENRKCEKFTYGGCKGNGNNFPDEGTCKEKCGDTTKIQSENICSLKPETGMGKASIKRFYYNPTTKKCEEFIYGGLGGNKNNFEDETICMETCGDICLLPKKIGRCKASIPRYYYNSENGKCEKFTYGGCKGNGNNFEDIKACQEKCVKQ